MKVSKIVEQTEKYDDLQGKIGEVERVLTDFDKINTTENREGQTIFYNGGTLSCSSFIVSNTVEVKEEAVSVFLNSELRELVQDDIKAILKKHLKELKKEQAELEI